MTPVESKVIGLTAYLALQNNAARNKRNKMRTHNSPPPLVSSHLVAMGTG